MTNLPSRRLIRKKKEKGTKSPTFNQLPRSTGLSPPWFMFLVLFWPFRMPSLVSTSLVKNNPFLSLSLSCFRLFSSPSVSFFSLFPPFLLGFFSHI